MSDTGSFLAEMDRLYLFSDLDLPSSDDSNEGARDHNGSHGNVGHDNVLQLPGHRVKKGAWKKGYTLPPCKVCGANGAGLHYGVNTCEACKGFFRRSLSRREMYTCKANQKCELGPGKRNMCSACRLRKCQEVGMSQQGIKIGRYTTEKCRQDTVEVKQFKAEQAQATLIQKAAERDARLQELVSVVTEAGRRHFDTLNTIQQELARLQDVLKEKVEKSHPGSNLITVLETMSSAEFNHFFQTVDPDPDIRVLVINKKLAFIDSMVKQFIKFAKAIPGFKEVNLEDQISLVKASFGDALNIHKYQHMDQDGNILSNGRRFDLRRFKACIPSPEHVNRSNRLGTRFRQLHLTDEETVMVLALILLSTDRCELSQPAIIDTIQENVMEALQWLIQKNHPLEPQLLGKLVSFLVESRSVGETGKKAVSEWIHRQGQNQGGVSVPDICWELLS